MSGFGDVVEILGGGGGGSVECRAIHFKGRNDPNGKVLGVFGGFRGRFGRTDISVLHIV